MDGFLSIHLQVTLNIHVYFLSPHHKVYRKSLHLQSIYRVYGFAAIVYLYVCVQVSGQLWSQFSLPYMCVGGSKSDHQFSTSALVHQAISLVLNNVFLFTLCGCFDCMFVQSVQCLQRPEKGIRFSGTEVTGDCELPSVGTGN